MVNEIGSKIMKNGWVDFQRNPKYCQKKLLDANHSMNGSAETNMLTSEIKSLFKKFINEKELYNFYGIKANPKMLNAFKKMGLDTFHIDSFVRGYFREFVYNIEISKDSFPFVSYDLAVIDGDAYIPGKFSWPKIFVFPCPVTPHYDVMKDELFNLAKNHYEKIPKSKCNIVFFEVKKEIYDSGIPPLIFDKDIVMTKVPGKLIKPMANVLLQYSGKYTKNYRNPDAD